MQIKITAISEMSAKVLMKDSIDYLTSLIGKECNLTQGDSMIISPDGRLIDIAYLEFEYL